MPRHNSHTLPFHLRRWYLFGRISLGRIALVGMIALTGWGCDGSQPDFADIATLTEPAARSQADRAINPEFATNLAANSVVINDSVLVSGSVSRRVPIVNGMVYRLEDDTGAMWIHTESPLAEDETELTVSGALIQQGADYYIYEKVRD